MVSIKDLTCVSTFLCLDDGDFASWASWGECTAQCEGVMHKTRECQATGEDACDSLTNATIGCNTQTCPGELSPGQTRIKVDRHILLPGHFRL